MILKKKIYFTCIHLLNIANFSSFIQLFRSAWTDGYFILWAIIYYFYYFVQVVEFALRVPLKLDPKPFCYDLIIF